MNDEPPILLTYKPKINLIEGSKKLITKSILNAQDNDGLPDEIIYEIIDEDVDKIGYFFIEPIEKSINSFSQLQIDSDQIYFRHNGTLMNKQVKLRIKDGSLPCSTENFHQENIHCTEEFFFNIFVHQLTLKVVNYSIVYLLQGSIKTVITSKNLATISSDNKNTDILYVIKESPKFGFIMVNDKSNDKFFQSDINSLAVSYVQTNMTPKDSFSVDILNNNLEIEKSIKNFTINIQVKPLIKAKLPFLICSPGSQVIITLDYLDAR